MNLGIVGCGEVAKEHLRALRSVRGINVVALCDKDEKTSERMSREWNVKAHYTQYSEMLDEEDLSIVSVLTPPQFHIPIAVEAIKRGVHVVIEKPLTMKANEANLLLEALKGSSVKLTVNHIMLFSKVMTEASRLIRSGRIGDVLGVEVAFLGTQDDLMASNQSHWCHKLPGGRLGEMLPHPIYAAQSVLDDELSVDSIVAEKRGKYPWMKYDELKAVLRGQKNGWADIYVSFNAARPVIDIGVFGTRKMLKIDMINQTLVELGERSLSKVDSARDLLGQSSDLFLSLVKNTIGFLGASRMEYSLRNMYVSFLDSITNGTDPVVTPRMACETVRITEEICNRI